MNTLTHLRWFALAAVVAALAIVALACGDDDDSPTIPTATPTTAAATPTTPTTEPTKSPTATPTTAASPDAAKVAPVLAALAANDGAALARLVAYTKVKCDNTPPQGFPQPPKCPAGVADDTAIEVFPAANCEGYYGTPAETATILAGGLGSVYGVFKKATAGGTPEFPQGIYGVITSSSTGGRLVGLDADGKVVTFWNGCGANAQQIAETRASGATWVVAPRP